MAAAFAFAFALPCPLAFPLPLPLALALPFMKFFGAMAAEEVTNASAEVGGMKAEQGPE
eukprot:CAMPEP_0171237406 /NCGR_PEP_ID=MMETSP0790-20130122/42951_1 /TAXON_ID=2925 /ORGANISM="Alexandrium catenella, Strain OF101" /LENGTH=58 /DNA_ID=CAMNT_0011703759 /DNA_START=12 /DNA_END=184 /DNA_ORIENTATION=-